MALFPAQPYSRRVQSVDIDGPVMYRDYGGDGRPPMLLVHGIGGSQLNWMLAAPALTEHFHVLALDLVGFGFTPLAGRTASLTTNRRVVARFIDRVAGAPATVVGHSMGGVIAMLTAAADPAVVDRLVLLDAAYGPGNHSPVPRSPAWLISLMSVVPALGNPVSTLVPRVEGVEATVRNAIAGVAGANAQIDQGLISAHVDQERRRLALPDPYLGFLHAWRSFGPMKRDLADWDRQLLPRILAPTLVIHGTADRAVPYANAERLLRLRPDWSLAGLEGVGHNGMMEAPDLFTQALLGWAIGAPPSPLARE
jgi:pimeloyl-ACP methyl ester carboxylesterase